MADILMTPVNRLAPRPSPQVGTGVSQDDKLRAAATNLEAQFLSEMLTHAGLGKSRESMGGGIGEDQFSSFLVQEQAKAMANKGGIGLAETLFEALKKGATHD